MTASTDPPQPEPPSADGSLEELPLNDAATVSAPDPGTAADARAPATKRIRCPHCSEPTEVGLPPLEGRTLRVVTQCPHCRYDLVVSRGDGDHMQIRACLRWETTCPYCKQPTVARVPPPGAGRRKELTPCASCRKPLVVERREEGKLVLRAHRGIIEGTLL